MTDSARLRLTPAPGRGHYDRQVSPELRRQQERARLMAAVVLESCARGPGHATIAGVVQRARMGRNSFYRHFAGLGPAQAAAQAEHCQSLKEALETRLRDSRTPLESLRALAQAWLTFATHQPKEACALTDPTPTRRGPLPELRVLADQLATVLAAAHKTGIAKARPTPLQLEAISAAWQAVGRACAERRADLPDAAALLADLAVRVIR